ncbi:MAG: hypothetical protein K2O70_09750 [Desulfovibrionaceae bacterium]|nr:hypothetical protein [Desulfovibrionaceae bacterium]
MAALHGADADNDVSQEVERLVQAYKAYFMEKARPTGPIPPSVVIRWPETAIGVVALETANELLKKELHR